VVVKEKIPTLTKNQNSVIQITESHFTSKVLAVLVFLQIFLCLCGIVTANGPTVHPPDDTRVNMEQQWNDTDRGKLKDSEKNLS
jgi:hypothetical protein